MAAVLLKLIVHYMWAVHECVLCTCLHTVRAIGSCRLSSNQINRSVDWL